MKTKSTADYTRAIIEMFASQPDFLKNSYVSLLNTVRTYQMIKQLYYETEPIKDENFKKIYSSFYAMNQWTGNVFKTNYFNAMLDLRTKPDPTNLYNHILSLSMLKDESNIKDKRVSKIQFSFGTKLLSLADDTNYPIYDRFVLFMFDIKEGITGDESDKLEEYKKRYETIRLTYLELLKRIEIKKLITNFCKLIDCSTLPEMRILDFMVWQLGKTLSAIDEKNKLDNKTQKK